MSQSTDSRTPITQLVNCLGLGGTERQLVEHLRRLDRSLYEPDLCCLQKVGEFLAEVREMGLEPEEFHLRGTLLQANTAFQVARLAARLRARRSRLLHSHDFYSNLIGSTAARLANVPHIVSRRDMGVWIGPSRARLLATITRMAPAVLCNAYAIRDRLVSEEGVDPARITVVHNGLDLARFDRKAKATSAADVARGERGPIVVLVGNMKHPVKGHTEFLTAAAMVLRAMPDCRFVLLGDGALREELARQARESGIGHAVIFAGRRTDVPAILSRATLSVCASHAEGLSNAVMESMAARLPVVATGVGGNVELVRDGRSGFLVPRGDSTALAHRMLELLRRPELARRMGVAGRRRIETEFSAELMAERMHALYDGLVRDGSGVSRAA